MIIAKEALSAGLNLIDRDPSSQKFLAASVSYLEYIIGRFIAQGRNNLVHLGQRILADNEDDQRIRRDIERTLEDTETRLDALVVSAARYCTGSVPGTKQFVQAANEFINFYNNVLAQRKNPAQEIIQKYFSDNEYWQMTDDVTEESIATEQRLFDAVREDAPDGVDFDWKG